MINFSRNPVTMPAVMCSDPGENPFSIGIFPIRKYHIRNIQNHNVRSGPVS